MMMCKILKVLIVLGLFIIAVFGTSRNNSACWESSAANVHVAAQVVPDVVVDLEILKRTSARLELQLKVSNTGKTPILVVTDPVRLDGSKGAYLSINEANSSQLEVAFAVYPPPFYTRLAPKTAVRFRTLNAGGTYENTVVLNTPLKETKPPWGDTPHVHAIDLEKIQQVRANVGVLPHDVGVREAIANEISADGFELVKSGPLKGKLLFELQTLVSSKILKL